MSWELTRREFIQGSIYFPSAIKAWFREQIDDPKEREIYQAFLPFVAEGARELSKVKLSWLNDLVWTPDWVDLTDTNQYVSTKIGECAVTVVGLRGHGMAPLRNLDKDQGEREDGITFIRSHWNPRIVEIDLKLLGEYEDLIRSRRLLARYFNPYLPSTAFGEWLLYDTGILRQLDCRYVGGLEFDELDKDINELGLTIQLRATRPLWYDPTQNDIDDSFTPGAFASTYVLTNNGDWDARGLLITLSVTGAGTIVDPVIENLTNSWKLDLTGYTLPNIFGNSIVYDLRIGEKIIRETNGFTSLARYLSTDSDLEQFTLKPGANTMRTTIGAASTGPTIKTNFFWYDQYLTC